MGAFIDLTGQRFGRLTVISRIGTKQGSPLWICTCDCRNKLQTTSRSLLSGNTTSCGCFHKDQLAKRNKASAKHGMEGSRLYGVWHSMLQRCYREKNKDYKNYGGRGIKICPEWKQSFIAFYAWAMAHGYDPDAPHGKCTLDRINVDGDYEPSNCQWVDSKAQANNRRNNRKEPQYG